MYTYQILDELLPFVQVAEAMAQKYHVVVTNPPYMGSSGMSGKLSEFIKKNYPDSKSDLFAVFIEHCGQMVKKDYYQAMITQHAWMFLSSFEKLRKKILQKTTINMAHLGARAFEEIGGEVVQTTSFVIVAMTLSVPSYILSESGLSFLGLGIQQPDASWGNMLKEAQEFTNILYRPWLLTPGFLIFVSVLAFNLIGDTIRDVLDPKSKVR